MGRPINQYEKALQEIDKNIWFHRDNCTYKKGVKNWVTKRPLQSKINTLGVLVKRATPKIMIIGIGNNHCQVCYRILNRTMNFCLECGQAIDWREE